MASCIFFPYFYLSNDTILRHQYLFVSSLMRIHPSDRPPRDSKHLKRFLSELNQFSFLENAVQEEYIESVNRRFLDVVERAFEKNLPEYLNYLGKYEKERTSAKTFHLCRKNQWEEITQRLLNLEIATLDHYDEWCSSTRTMVLTFNTCLALHYQRQLNLSRCTDAIEHDDLAVLLECAPQADGSDGTILRAAMEFPYTIPRNIPEMQLDRLQTLHEDLKHLTVYYMKTLPEDAAELQFATSPMELTERLDDLQRKLIEINAQITEELRIHNEPLQTFYGQYRWYIPPSAPLAGVPIQSPISKGKELTFTTKNVAVAESEIDTLASYPGCHIWTLEAPALMPKSSGWLKRLFSFGK